jgi:hypothetical protein
VKEPDIVFPVGVKDKDEGDAVGVLQVALPTIFTI